MFINIHRYTCIYIHVYTCIYTCMYINYIHGIELEKTTIRNKN